MSGLPPGQHEWEATFGRDDAGRPVPPRFHKLLVLGIRRRPTASDVRRLEGVLAELEERTPYGPEGLLTTLGWGPSWFEGHTPFPMILGRPVPMARWERPVIEDHDAVLHLASDHEELLTEIVGDLFGDSPRDLRDQFELLDERSGFVGAGLPRERLPQYDIPESSPLLLGFRSVLTSNQASEERITIADGPLAGGTTAHISRIELDLDHWYSRDRDDQAALLYAPTISAREADEFVDDAPSDYRSVSDTVARHGIVGHTQAAARARIGDVPLINRRDFATVDDERPGTHFIALQRELRDFNNTRAIMNAADASEHHSAVGVRSRNGINAFMTVTHRATVAIPPRRARAYPLLDPTGTS